MEVRFTECLERCVEVFGSSAYFSFGYKNFESWKTIKRIKKQQNSLIQWFSFSFSYFNENIGHRTVPIEIGSSYANSDWKQTLMTFRDFIKKFVECEV